MSEEIERPASQNTLVPQGLREKIDQLLGEINDGQWQLGQKVVQLGTSLIEVRRSKAWKAWGFDSFNAYITSIKDKVDKGRTQLYGYISVAEKLLPHVSAERIEQMGISKASELAKLISVGQVPSEELVAKAIDPKVTVQEVRAEVFGVGHIKGEIENGKYWDLGAIYVMKDERLELERALEVATRVDPVIPMHWPEASRRKEAWLRMAREFLATYEADVEKGIA